MCNKLKNKEKIKVLFVCMGNICRSPTADAVMTAMVKEKGLDKQIIIDSAGTHAYHVGEMSDRRSAQVARQRGYDMDYIRARKVTLSDFEEFDYILAMDEDNYQILMDLCPDEHCHKVAKFLSYSNTGQSNVPDPYYGGPQGFEKVFDLVEKGCQGLLDKILNS